MLKFPLINQTSIERVWTWAPLLGVLRLSAEAASDDPRRRSVRDGAGEENGGGGDEEFPSHLDREG